MKHRVEDLQGVLLDAAVAKAEGHNWRIYTEADSPIGRPLVVAWLKFHTEGDSDEFEPSSDWAAGGPIIERERITVCGPDFMKSGLWEAFIEPLLDVKRQEPDIIGRVEEAGPTPLVAAMRAFVKSKFGNDVDITQ